MIGVAGGLFAAFGTSHEPGGGLATVFVDLERDVLIPGVGLPTHPPLWWLDSAALGDDVVVGYWTYEKELPSRLQLQRFSCTVSAAGAARAGSHPGKSGR